MLDHRAFCATDRAGALAAAAMADVLCTMEAVLSAGDGYRDAAGQ